MKSKLFKFIAALGLMASCLEAAPDEHRTRLRFVSLGQPILEAGILKADGSAVPVAIPSDALSREITHIGGGRLRLVSLDRPKSEPMTSKSDAPRPEDIPPQTRGFRKQREMVSAVSGEHVGKELGAIELPPLPNQRMIVLVHPGVGPGLTAILDRVGSFPPGSDRYVNLCPVPVTIDVPSGRRTLPPKESVVLRPGVTQSRQYPLRLLTGLKPDETTFFSSIVIHEEDVRVLRVISIDPHDPLTPVLRSVTQRATTEDALR